MNIEDAARMAYGYVPGKEPNPLELTKAQFEENEPLAMQLNTIKLLRHAVDRIEEMERKVSKLEKIVDRVREFTPEVE